MQENELTRASFDAEAFAIELPKINLIDHLAARSKARRNNVPRLLETVERAKCMSKAAIVGCIFTSAGDGPLALRITL